MTRRKGSRTRVGIIGIGVASLVASLGTTHCAHGFGERLGNRPMARREPLGVLGFAGKIRDAEGHPLPGFRVEGELAQRRMARGEDHCTIFFSGVSTDQDGHFEARTDCAPGTPVSLRFRPSWSTTQVHTLTATAGSLDLDVVIDWRNLRDSHRALSPKPVGTGEITVRLSPPAAQAIGLRATGPTNAWARPGNYQLKGLAHGRYLVSAGPGYQPEAVEIRGGPVDVVLAARTEQTVTIHVVDHDGAPLAATVIITEPSGLEHSGLRVDRGRGLSTSLAPGLHTVHVFFGWAVLEKSEAEYSTELHISGLPDQTFTIKLSEVLDAR